ncbi:MAG TPA: hypothetical protein PKD90_16865 [Phnomibacter sp.]|nr:hypothetical protein [Phnomibacter sp.]
MNSRTSDLEKHFVPECYFDTMLVMRLLDTKKRLLHKKGCNNVVNELATGKLKDTFAVAVVDKDKTELEFLKKCTLLREEDGWLLWKRINRPQFVIQLYPPLEKWLQVMLGKGGYSIVDFGYSADLRQLKRQIKMEIDTEKDEKLNNLIGVLLKCNLPTIEALQRVLKYLKMNNFKTDVNALKYV